MSTVIKNPDDLCWDELICCVRPRGCRAIHPKDDAMRNESILALGQRVVAEHPANAPSQLAIQFSIKSNFAVAINEIHLAKPAGK